MAAGGDKAFPQSIQMNPVRNQENCNCCWAIAACSSIDCKYFLNGRTVETAPQELLDCMEPSEAAKKLADERKCFKSNMTKAYRYVMEHGIHHERDYVFKAERGACKRDKGKEDRVRIRSCMGIKDDADQEARLMKELEKHPVAAAIIVDKAFRDYKGGIYMGPTGKEQYGHAVLIVGYGCEVVDGKRINFWIVRNSFGEGWGEKGYCRYVRHSSQPEGTASLVTRASYPLI